MVREFQLGKMISKLGECVRKDLLFCKSADGEFVIDIYKPVLPVRLDGLSLPVVYTLCKMRYGPRVYVK